MANYTTIKSKKTFRNIFDEDIEVNYQWIVPIGGEPLPKEALKLEFQDYDLVSRCSLPVYWVRKYKRSENMKSKNIQVDFQTNFQSVASISYSRERETFFVEGHRNFREHLFTLILTNQIVKDLGEEGEIELYGFENIHFEDYYKVLIRVVRNSSVHMTISFDI